MSKAFYKVMVFIARPIIFLIVKYKFVNRNNMPKEGRVVVASNHVSAFDPLCIALGQKRYIHFLAKKELFSKKFTNWFLRKLGAFPVDREKNDIVAMKWFMRGLKEDEAMGIFFEGTRSKTGDFLEPKEGAALFAFQTQSPVLPVCITKIGKRRVVHFGDLLTTDELGFDDDSVDKKTKLKNATDIIFSKVKEMREIDLNA